MSNRTQVNVWIDLDNSPHVLFFTPIIRELEKQGARCVVTLRRASQTEDLARQKGLEFIRIGRHYESRSLTVKVLGTAARAISLASFIRGRGVSAAISHGSRAMVLAAYSLRIPIMTLYDYEFASYRLFNMLSGRLMAPSVIPIERLMAQGLDPKKLVRYPGLKEEVYVYDFSPSRNPPVGAKNGSGKALITIRPPASWAHYHEEKSEVLFQALLRRLQREPNIQVVILARSAKQESTIHAAHDLDPAKFLVLSKAVDGLSLMSHSDAIFSGGGTMTREAALLGLNVFSIFGGQLGACDEYLASLGRLKVLSEPQQVEELSIPVGSGQKPSLKDHKHLAASIAQEVVRFATEKSQS